MNRKSTTIRKTVIEVTVFHHPSDDLETWGIERIIGELNDGYLIGGFRIFPSEDITHNAMDAHLVDLCNNRADRNRFEACACILSHYDWDRIGGMKDKTGWTHIGDEAWVDVKLGQADRFTHRLVIEFEPDTHTVIRAELLGPPVGT